MTDTPKPKSKQARYLERVRARAGGQVTFVPRDKRALDQIVARSGHSQAEWLCDAVDEKIARSIKMEKPNFENVVKLAQAINQLTSDAIAGLDGVMVADAFGFLAATVLGTGIRKMPRGEAERALEDLIGIIRGEFAVAKANVEQTA